MITRGGSYQSVFDAICRRIAITRPDLLEAYGIVRVMEAIRSVASQFESIELDEIGTSDVSCWVADIEASLKRSTANEGKSNG